MEIDPETGLPKLPHGMAHGVPLINTEPPPEYRYEFFPNVGQLLLFHRGPKMLGGFIRAETPEDVGDYPIFEVFRVGQGSPYEPGELVLCEPPFGRRLGRQLTALEEDLVLVDESQVSCRVLLHGLKKGL